MDGQFKVMPYGTNGHHYPVYLSGYMVADFVEEECANDYAAYRNTATMICGTTDVREHGRLRISAD